MKTIELAAESPVMSSSTESCSTRRHSGAGRKRNSAWRVLGSTVAGFPAFLWQLTKTHRN